MFDLSSKFNSFYNSYVVLSQKEQNTLQEKENLERSAAKKMGLLSIMLRTIPTYEERSFKEEKNSRTAGDPRRQKIREQESLIEEKDAETKLCAAGSRLCQRRTQRRKDSISSSANLMQKIPVNMETRKRYIDLGLKLIGWEFDGENADVREEYPIDDMNGVPGKKGAADYVLFERRTAPRGHRSETPSKDPNDGEAAGVSLCGRSGKKIRPPADDVYVQQIRTLFWDDQTGPQRKVSGFFSKEICRN